MIKSTEKFNLIGPILNTTKLGLIRLSVYNSVFNVNRRNIQFLYASTVLDDVEALPQALSSNSNFNSNPSPNPNFNSSSIITSVLNYIYEGIPLLY